MYDMRFWLVDEFPTSVSGLSKRRRAVIRKIREDGHRAKQKGERNNSLPDRVYISEVNDAYEVLKSDLEDTIEGCTCLTLKQLCRIWKYID